MELENKIDGLNAIADKVNREKWDNDMLRAVFTPIFAELVAVDLLTKSIDALADAKVPASKKRSRSARQLIREVMIAWSNGMVGKLWESVKEQVAEFQHGIVSDLFLHQQSYVREALNLDKTGDDVSVAVATMLIARDICREVLEYDKEADKLKADIASKYGQKPAKKSGDSWISIGIIREVDGFLSDFGFPKEIENQNITTARKILRKRIYALKF